MKVVVQSSEDEVFRSWALSCQYGPSLSELTVLGLMELRGEPLVTCGVAVVVVVVVAPPEEPRTAVV